MTARAYLAESINEPGAFISPASPAALAAVSRPVAGVTPARPRGAWDADRAPSTRGSQTGSGSVKSSDSRAMRSRRSTHAGSP